MGFVERMLGQAIQFDFAPFLVAIVVGSAIGLEREIHGRPAGLRTHILVCLSATVLIHASRIVPAAVQTGSLLENIVYDPNRLGAGIVTGIGFLGAAAVIRSGDIVRGITTGACVWGVACLGVVIGQGHYAIALVGAFTMLIVLVAFDYLFVWVTPIVYRKLTIVARQVDIVAVRDRAAALLLEARVTVQDVSCRIRPQEDAFDLIFHVRSRSRSRATDLVAQVAEIEGVEVAEWGQIQQ
jgi:putative Mg2+ transporter-C (MgtC) family protein